MDWCPYRLFPHSVVCGNDCLIKDARERMPWKRPKHVCQCLRQHSFVITSEISIVIFKRNPKITTRFIVSSAVLDSLSELWRGCLFSVHAPSTFCLTTALSHRYVPRQGPAVNDPHHGLTHSYDTCWVPFFAPQGQTSCLWGQNTTISTQHSLTTGSVILGWVYRCTCSTYSDISWLSDYLLQKAFLRIQKDQWSCVRMSTSSAEYSRQVRGTAQSSTDLLYRLVSMKRDSLRSSTWNYE